MKRILHSSVALLCLWTLVDSSFAASKKPEASRAVARSEIKNRDQLLAAINTWLQEHHQPEWTMDELIGRAFDQVYINHHAYDDSPLDPPVETFLISLIKNRPFPREARLRSDRRDEITVHTAPDEITRQRIEWAKSRKSYESWIKVHATSSDFTRRLPLPLHHSLTLDIISTSRQIRRDNSPGKAPRTSIFLASALGENGNSQPASGEAEQDLPGLAATPAQLVDKINQWKRSVHQPEIALAEITARVADEIFNLRDNRDDLWNSDLELFVECLVQNAPFIFPIDVHAEEPPTPRAFDSVKMFSINEGFPLPSRYTASITISCFPPDMKEEEPLVEVWETTILSYSFPSKTIETKATRNKAGR